MKRFTLIALVILSFSLADNYTLSVSEPTHGDIQIDEDELTYIHTGQMPNDKSIILDSISVVATDDGGNSSNAVTSYILVLPKRELELYAINNPLEIIGTNVKAITGLPSGFNLSTYEDGKGILFVLTGNIEITYGRVVIFDPVGNLINNTTIFQSDRLDKLTVIGVWDGKNNNGRLVGAGSYAVFIEIEAYEYIDPSTYELPVGFEDVIISPSLTGDKIKQQFNTVVGIKQL